MTDFQTREGRSKLIDPYYADKSYILRNITFITAGAVIGMVALTFLKSCNPAPAPALVKQFDCSNCHNRKQAMTDYFKKAGSKTPEEMAVAVLSTNNPRLLAAIAKVETGGNSHIRKGGYKGLHAGAFQVNPYIHGKVSHNSVQQALQAESILTELTDTMPIKRALSQYGGDSTSKYSNRVLAELAAVP